MGKGVFITQYIVLAMCCVGVTACSTVPPQESERHDPLMFGRTSHQTPSSQVTATEQTINELHPRPRAPSLVQIPLVTSVELTQFDKTWSMDPLMDMFFRPTERKPDIGFSDEIMSHAVIQYAEARQTFKRIVRDETGEAILSVKATYKVSSDRGHAVNEIGLESLLATTADRRLLGTYSGQGRTEAVQCCTSPENQQAISDALKKALDALFEKIEQDQPSILAKLREGQGPANTGATGTPTTPPPIY